jgi:microcin C transport system permease protein
LLAQGKSNIDAWWLSMSTFMVLVGTLILLIFIGEALRETFDPRQLVKKD